MRKKRIPKSGAGRAPGRMVFIVNVFWVYMLDLSHAASPEHRECISSPQFWRPGGQSTPFSSHCGVVGSTWDYKSWNPGFNSRAVTFFIPTQFRRETRVPGCWVQLPGVGSNTGSLTGKATPSPGWLGCSGFESSSVNFFLLHPPPKQQSTDAGHTHQHGNVGQVRRSRGRSIHRSQVRDAHFRQSHSESSTVRHPRIDVVI